MPWVARFISPIRLSISHICWCLREAFSISTAVRVNTEAISWSADTVIVITRSMPRPTSVMSLLCSFIARPTPVAEWFSPLILPLVYQTIPPIQCPVQQGSSVSEGVPDVEMDLSGALTRHQDRRGARDRRGKGACSLAVRLLAVVKPERPHGRL